MYIDKESWLCMLGAASKNIEEHDEIYKYESNKNNNIITSRALKQEDISLLKKYVPFKFYYLSAEDLQLLKKNFKLEFNRSTSVEIKLGNLDFVGNDYKGIRNSINKAKKYNIEFREEPTIEELREFCNRWDETSGERYFQRHTSKNMFYFKQGYHKEKISTYCYIDGKLVSFGVLSTPVNGYSSYICGKALCHDYAGLSEYTDMVLYKKGMENGVKVVNLGEGQKGLLWYKLKFPGAEKVYYYNGKITNVV